MNRCTRCHEYLQDVKLLRKSGGKLIRLYVCDCGCQFEEEVPE